MQTAIIKLSTRDEPVWAAKNGDDLYTNFPATDAEVKEILEAFDKLQFVKVN